MGAGAPVVRREPRGGELEPVTNRGESSMIANTVRADQGTVQRGHGWVRFGLALRQLEQRSPPLPRQDELVQIPLTRVGGVGPYSGGRM